MNTVIKLEDFAKIVRVADYSCRSVDVKRGQFPGIVIIEVDGGDIEIILSELEKYKPLGIEFHVKHKERENAMEARPIGESRR